MTRRNVKETIERLEQEAARAMELVAELRAVGTGDVEDGVKAVRLRDSVEALLRVSGPMSLPELCEELGAPAGKVNAVLSGLKRAGTVWNAGTEDRPRWRWVVGDAVTFPELVDEVHHLLAQRPMSHADLRAATGANPNRLKGAVTQLQRNGLRVLNLGEARRALWYARAS